MKGNFIRFGDRDFSVAEVRVLALFAKLDTVSVDRLIQIEDSPTAVEHLCELGYIAPFGTGYISMARGQALFDGLITYLAKTFTVELLFKLFDEPYDDHDLRDIVARIY